MEESERELRSYPSSKKRKIKRNKIPTKLDEIVEENEQEDRED